MSLTTTTTAMNKTNMRGMKRVGHLHLTSNPSNCKKRRTIDPSNGKADKTTLPVASLARTKCEVRRVAPTLRGVQEASRVMGLGEILVIPSETVYICCTALRSSAVSKLRSAVGNETTTPLLMVNDLEQVPELLQLKRKPYAIKEKDFKPVCFNESTAILNRLAARYWPGSFTAYIRIPEPSTLLPHQSRFVGIASPSHPLATKVLSQTDLPVLGVLTRFRKASHVWTHYLQTKNCSVFVLNGEDKREEFTVPTCRQSLCHFSVWIDQDIRTIYVKGKRPAENNNDSLIKDLYLTYATSPPADSTTDPVRSRVVTAVLRKWKIVDCRV